MSKKRFVVYLKNKDEPNLLYLVGSVPTQEDAYLAKMYFQEESNDNEFDMDFYFEGETLKGILR